jgi:hypothetical protein
MKRINTIPKAIKKISNPKRRLIPARMGSGADYASISTGIPNKIWVTYEGSGQIAQVWNLRLPSVAGLRVLVGEDPNYPGLLQVIRERLQPGGTPITQLGAHHETHEIYGSDKVNVSGNQIIPLNVVPIAGTFTVIIKDAIILAGDVWAYVNPQNLDLTSSVPAAGALWALIQSDASGVCTLKLSATVTAKALLTIDGIPLPDNAFFPLCAVRLYAGQTELRLDSAINDFKDLRWGQGSGAGAPTISTTNVIVDGTFDGTTAWVVGTPIEWVISGGKATATDATVTRLSQYVPPVLAGYTYKVTYTVDSISEGSVIVIVGNTEGTPRDAAGTYTEYIFAAATNFEFAPHDTPLTCVIDDVSAEIITGIIPQTPNRIVISDADGIVGSSNNLSYDDTINNLTMGGNNPPWAAEPDTIINSAEGHSFGITGMVFSDDVTKSDYRTTLRAGGTASAPTKVLDGMIISRWRGRGYYDNSGGVADTRVEIRLVADGDWSATSTPTRIEMYTTPVDATVPVLVITLESDGTVNIPTGSTYNINGTPHTHAGGSAHEIRSNGTPMTARSGLNFIGGTVDDNAGADSTDVTITGGGVASVTGDGVDNTDPSNPKIIFSIGDEEVVNPYFETDTSGWTIGAGWTRIGAENLQHTVGNVEPVFQDGSPIFNAVHYVCLISVSGRTAGTLTIVAGASSIEISTNNDFMFEILWYDSGTKFTITPSTDFDGSLGGVSLKRSPYVQDVILDNRLYGRKNYAWEEITGGGVAPVDPSVVGNLVSFADVAGAQADSGIAAADLFGYPDLAAGAEEIVNGTFATDASDWVLGAGWAWTGAGQVTHTPGNTEAMYQSGTLDNLAYSVLLMLGGGTAGTITVTLDDGDSVVSDYTGFAFWSGLYYGGSNKKIIIAPSTDYDGYIQSVSVMRVNFLQDAPVNPSTYARKAGDWIDIAGSAVSPVNPSVAGNIVMFSDTTGAQADSGIAAADVLVTGDAATPELDNLTTTAINADLTFAKDTTRTISVENQPALSDASGQGLYLQAANGDGSGNGGDFYMYSGAGGATGAGGTLSLIAGGAGETSGNGGEIVITAGNAGGDSNAGSVSLKAGNRYGSGNPGYVKIVNGEYSAKLDSSLVGGESGDATFTFPNKNGTFAMLDDVPAAYVHPNHSGDVTSVADGATTIAAKAVDVAMLADGTDGELITWGADGVATTVPVGTATHVLTSNGAGAAPTFQAPAAASVPSQAAESILANATASAAVPSAVTVAEQTIIGRITGGHVDDLSASQVRTLINVADGATANVGTVTDVTGTSPVASTGGATPAISMPAATAAAAGHATAAQITKLDGIEAAADVTDATNVAAAGAGMVGTANTWLTGQVIGDGTGPAGFILNGAAANNRQVVFRTNSVARAILTLNTTAEGGANAGSDVQLVVYDDAGANGLTALLVKRSTGQVRIGSATAPAYPLDVTGDINSSTAIKVGGTALVTNATHSGDVTGATALTIANKVTMTGTSPVAVSGSPTVIAAGAVAVSLVNDAAAAITQFDTATLSALDTDIPTSKAVGTAISTHAALRTGVHGMGASYQIIQQGNPTAETTGAVTVTIAKMLTGIVSGNPSAARAYTLDTGTNCDGGMTISTNEAFDWVLINLATTATYIITLTAAAGHTIVGNPLIAAQSGTTGGLWGTSSAMFRTRKTAANTFITYRIA